MAAAAKGRSKGRVPAANLTELNDRLMNVEINVSEHLLELKHVVQSHGTAISGVQSDMHRLVQITEQMVKLQHEQATQSSAINRAFNEISKNRDELAADLAMDRQDFKAALRDALEEFREWRKAHETDNKMVADIVLQHRAGIRVTWAVFGLVGLLSGGWMAVEKQRMEERVAYVDQRLDAGMRAHQSSAAASDRRIENRLDRLERERDER